LAAPAATFVAIERRVMTDLAYPSVPKRRPTMNFHQLILNRTALLRQARLANLAFAWQRLDAFATRIARARLHGQVTLRLADPEADRPWPVLLAHEGNQSVIEEYFLDEEVVELADILVFLSENNQVAEFTFQLEELASRFLPGLQHELESAGIRVGQTLPAPEDSSRGHT